MVAPRNINNGQVELESAGPLPRGLAPLQNDPRLDPRNQGSGQLQVNPNAQLASSDPWQGLFDRMRNTQYQGIMKDDGSDLKDPFKVNAPKYVQSIQNRYTDLYDDGASPGLSNWGEAAYNRSRADQGYALEDARGQAMSDAASGMNTLAMQGGLESGAAENMLRSANRNADQTRTNLYRQGSMDRMGIDVADASRKDTMRTQGLAGGMEVARYDTDLQNLNSGRAVDDLRSRNEFDFGKLGFEGQMEAARATSNAMGKMPTGSSSGGLMNTIMNPLGSVFKLNSTAKPTQPQNLWSNNPSYANNNKGYKQF